MANQRKSIGTDSNDKDPMNQAKRFIRDGLPESSKRVAEIRKRFSRLMHTSNYYGAGGITDTERYQLYLKVVQMCYEHARKNIKKAAGHDYRNKW